MPFARYELGLERQLVRGETHGLFRVGLAHAFHLEQNLSRTHNCDPMIRRTFALAHTSFSRLLRHRLVGKETQPNFAAALHETRHRHATRFDLAVGDVAALEDLQSVITE